MSFLRHSVPVGRGIWLARRGVHGYRSNKPYDFGGPPFFVRIAGIVVRMGVHSANALQIAIFSMDDSAALLVPARNPQRARVFGIRKVPIGSGLAAARFSSQF